MEGIIMNNDELDEEFLRNIKGGLNRDAAIEMGRQSKFEEVREMADAEDLKLRNSDTIVNNDKEFTEEELDKMAYDYYHDEKSYGRR